jgi:hypothetical protein
MGFLNDEHWVRIVDSDVVVSGKSGVIEATWKLTGAGNEADSIKGSGELHLHGDLGDGTKVDARVKQTAFGPAEVVVSHEGTDIVRFRGFVA